MSSPRKSHEDMEQEALPSSQVRETNFGGLHTESLSVGRLWCLYFGTSMGLFLAFLETSIVATSLFHIGEEFQTLQDLNWVALAYTLSYMGLAVLSAQVSNVVGRRNAFLGFFFWFTAFSIACGFAQTLRQLIGLRVLQGLGGSGLYSVGMICTTELAPQKIEKFLGALIGVIVTISSVLGPVVGGALTEYTTWRWIFWINGPLGAFSMLLAFLAWPKGEARQSHHQRRWSELDYVGSFLLISAVVLIVFSFQNAGAQPDQWPHAIFLGPLLLGLFCLAALFGWSLLVERRWRDRLIPALPLRVLRNRVFTSAVLTTVLLSFMYLMIVYVFPLRSQIVNGKNAIVAGVLLLPMLITNAIGIAGSRSINRDGDKPAVPQMIAASLMMIGGGLLTTLSSSYELEAKSLGFLVFVGLGYGISISTTTITAATEPSAEDHASAQGLVAQSRVLGGTLGIAASSAILGTKLGPQLAHVTPDQIAAGSLPASTLESVRQLYSEAFTKDMQVCTIIAGVAILAGAMSWRRSCAVTTTEQRGHELAQKEKTAVEPRPGQA